MMNGKSLPIYLHLSIIFSILAPAGASAEIQVVAIGDSITAGYPYLQIDANGCRCPQEGFEVQLEAKLDASNRPATVYNYGNPGDSTFGMLNRIEQILNAVGPDVVLLMGGTNDIAFFSPGTIASNLAAMIDKVRAYNGEPILGTITPDTSASNSFKDIPTYNQYIINMANDRDVSIADHYSAIVGAWAGLTTDGLHLTSAGNNVLAQNWFNSFPDSKDVDPDLNIIDNDGDSYTENQGDCNDTNSSIHPFANDVCGDEIDQNCDGKDEQCPNIIPTIMILLNDE